MATAEAMQISHYWICGRCSKKGRAKRKRMAYRKGEEKAVKLENEK